MPGMMIAAKAKIFLKLANPKINGNKINNFSLNILRIKRRGMKSFFKRFLVNFGAFLSSITSISSVIPSIKRAEYRPPSVKSSGIWNSSAVDLANLKRFEIYFWYFSYIIFRPTFPISLGQICTEPPNRSLHFWVLRRIQTFRIRVSVNEFLVTL